MKTAFIKQQPDIFGPWKSVPFGDIITLTDVWPGKASYFEFTLLMRADWYVIGPITTTEYTRNIVEKCPQFSDISKNYTQTVSIENIPFYLYDLVVSFDPLPNITRPGKTLYAYFVHEHWDSAYLRSTKCPLYGYDLFLAHADTERSNLDTLPTSIFMPYPRDPDSIRKLYKVERKDIIYIDWRTITALQKQHIWTKTTSEIYEEVQKLFNIKSLSDWSFGSSFYGFADPPRWGDVNNYLINLLSSKYFISIGRESGAGQAVCDAASAGCICIGTNRAYHKMICHPFCLCSNIEEASKVISTLQTSLDLQKEVLNHQDIHLRAHFVDYPLRMLKKAIGIKEKTS